MTAQVMAIVGGQYGSEGKGVVVSHLANRYSAHVRVGGPNAGHSHVHAGRVWKQQSLPCGWTNPDALLVLGRGGLINFPQLLKEVQEVEATGFKVRHRLKIDMLAGTLEEHHHQSEGGVEGALHHRIGSTGEGVGAARIARLQRSHDRFKLAFELAEQYGLHECLHPDVSELLLSRRRDYQDTLLEGTQGSGLSLVHGPWPYVTTADTNAAQMASDVGIPPRFVNRTVLVIRSHPIRVAGPSGPLKNETSWDAISQRLGKRVIEQTTVTRKIRRVGEWDEELVRQAVKLNAPTSLALMFADYIDPLVEGVSTWSRLQMHAPVMQFIDYLENTFNVPVALIGTGGTVPTPENPDALGWRVVDRGIEP